MHARNHSDNHTLIHHNSFDDPVHKYVPYWTSESSDPRSEITLRHLLSFRSGYLTNAGDVPCAAESKIGNFDTCTKALYEKIKLGAKPGTVWDYNSYHLQFAGAMATAAANLTIEQVLDKYLLKKLGMANSTWGG
jgi:CubicO group peptidase (beta-lactamase class C family)